MLTVPDSVNDELFRLGAGIEAISELQRQEADLRCKALVTVKSLPLNRSSRVNALAYITGMTQSLGVAVGHEEATDVWFLSVSYLDSLGSTLLTQTGSEARAQELVVSCCALVIIACKTLLIRDAVVFLRCRGLIPSVIQEDGSRSIMPEIALKERFVLTALQHSVTRPTASSWIRIMKYRLKELLGKDRSPLIDQFGVMAQWEAEQIIFASCPMPGQGDLPSHHLIAGLILILAFQERPFLSTDQLIWTTGLDASTLESAAVMVSRRKAAAQEFAAELSSRTSVPLKTHSI